MRICVVFPQNVWSIDWIVFISKDLGFIVGVGHGAYRLREWRFAFLALLFYGCYYDWEMGDEK